MHPEAEDFIREKAEELGPFRSVVEIGGRNVNGSMRKYFPLAVERGDYTGLDLEDGPEVDVVIDAALWEPPEWVECVVCCEVLEHAENAEILVRRAAEWLQPRGVFLMTCAYPGRTEHSAHDGWDLREGEFYRNVDVPTFTGWAEHVGFRRINTFVHALHRDLYAVCIK